MASTEKKPEDFRDNEADNPTLEKGALEQIQEPYQFTPQEERRLVWKIDLMILPIMLIAYMMAFLDKQTLSYTSLMGLREDLHLVGSEYSWSSSIFYFGYLFFSWPASLLMVRFPLGKYLACNFIIWAVVLACHAATKNFAGIMVTRFFLGVTEASLSPGFSLLTSLWYRTSEQPLRHGIWFCGNSISLIIGNVIAVGIWQIKGGLHPWQWIFIIFGLITFVWGVLMLFRLPDSPSTASFLNENERLIAMERLRSNKAGYKSNKIDRDQIFEALRDVKTWLLAVLILASNIPNGGFTTFNGLILKGFGYSTFRTLLLGMPGGAVVFVFVLASSIISSKVPNSRCIVIAVVSCISILGSALVYATSSIASRYAGLLLMGLYSVGMPLSMAMISSNIGGFTKRATVSAIYFIMYCAGNIIGPQLFFEDQAPKYESGFQAILVCLVVVVVDVVALGYYLRWENSRRDKKYPRGSSETQRQLADTTDLQNKEFRYVY
ncbi:major facilitator superfamily domain-containing protein [Aspergillus ambiguus]|uniref:putative MFS allantoate transporter n=1 Tax=Aspergillus ambiguus TaxID=176160 RepID=UPI003CCE0C0F